MRLLFWILPLIFVILWLTWYLTCIDRDDFPVIGLLAIFILGILPGVNLFICIYVYYNTYKNWDFIDLKDNWFNNFILRFNKHAE